MNICIISPTFPLPGESPYLGPDNAVYNLVESIAHNHSEISIHVITIRNDIKSELSYQSSKNIFITYIPAVKFLPRSFGDPILVKNFLKNKKYDLIHSHYPIALLKIINTNIPIILTLHGIFTNEKKFVKNPFVRLFYHDYTAHMMKRILPKLDAFVAISPYVLDELKNIGCHNKIKHIYQINNAISNSFFEIESNPVDSMIFYPAGIRKLKNQIAAIKVMEMLKEQINGVNLVLAGGLDKHYSEQVFSKIESSGCLNSVNYIGSVSRNKMLDLYSKTSIVYLLSLQEVQPMVVLEAMASGVPVIASNLKSISYIIDNGVTGYLVDPNDIEKIVECTVELLNNDLKRSVMGSRAKEEAKKKYHANSVAEKTVEMYMQVLNQK